MYLLQEILAKNVHTFLGFVEVSIMHPLDLVKTRFQIQRGPEDPNRYTSIADCFKKMYRNEGLVVNYCVGDISLLYS